VGSTPSIGTLRFSQGNVKVSRVMRRALKRLALACKVMAVAVWVGGGAVKILWIFSGMWAANPPRDAPPDWGTPSYFHRTYLEIFIILVVALLSAIPNRRLVVSPVAFSLSLLSVLFPLCAVLIRNLSGPFSGPPDLFGWFLLIFIFAPLPLSLLLSFWRHQTGAEVSYV
jgi:hypothetical protein